MSIYRTHILLPVDEGTVQAGAFEIKRRLERRWSDKTGQGNEILECGTVGLVGKGVILAVYPDRMYYFKVKESDVARIIEEHLLKGRVVADLAHAPVDMATAAAQTGAQRRADPRAAARGAGQDLDRGPGQHQ